MFVKASFSKSIIFKVKSKFEPNVLKMVIKKKKSINEKYSKNFMTIHIIMFPLLIF